VTFPGVFHFFLNILQPSGIEYLGLSWAQKKSADDKLTSADRSVLQFSMQFMAIGIVKILYFKLHVYM